MAAALVGQPDSTALEQKADSTAKQEFTNSNIEYQATEKLENNMGRLNLFYGLPGNTKMYTFVEFYPEDGFFARTMASTPINKHKTHIQTEMKNSNMFPDQMALGLLQKFDVGPVYGEIKAFPAWFDSKGSVQNSASVGGLIGTSFDIGKKGLQVDVSAFGEMNVAKKGGPQWAYGEAEAKVSIPTKIGKFDVGAGYNFYPTGKAEPSPLFRAKIGYHPRK